MGQGVRSHVPEVTLTGFLSRCRSDWKQRDLDAVVEKLAAVGVFKVGELIRLLQEGILNERLTAVGEKRFTAETLRAMRSTGAELDVGPSAQQPGLPDAGLHGDDMSTDSGEEEDLGMHFPGGLNASQGVWASRRPFPAFEQPQTLRRRLCRGLACVERAATEAKRRNRDVTQCLAEVQSDITRISERMQAVRRKQQQQQQQQQRRRVTTKRADPSFPQSLRSFEEEFAVPAEPQEVDVEETAALESTSPASSGALQTPRRGSAPPFNTPRGSQGSTPLKLGCPQCHYSPSGCSRCKGKAHGGSTPVGGQGSSGIRKQGKLKEPCVAAAVGGVRRHRAGKA